MSTEERAWLGAFIEADGSAWYAPSWGVLNRKAQLCITQKEIDPIATALRITGCGRVYYQGINGCWRWSVGRQADCLAIMEQCASYSWKIQRALERWHELGRGH